MKKNLKLSKAEIARCQELFEQITDDAALLDQELSKLGKDGAQCRREIEFGIDEFYRLNSGNVSKEDIRQKIAEAAKDMSPIQEYRYLANVLTAIAHIGHNVFVDDTWSKCMKDHESILAAIDNGIIDEDNALVKNGLGEMRSLLAENIEALAPLFGNSMEMARIQESCLNDKPEEVQAIVMNTREAAFNMAAAAYILQERDELPSLGKTRFSARDIGVLSASMLEIDAAAKSGSADTLKKVFSKVSRTAVTLLVSSPAIIVGIGMFSVFSLLTNFATVWMLIGAAVIGLNLKLHYDSLKDKLSPCFKVGGRILDTTLEKAGSMYRKLSDWVQNTAIPAAIPVWQRSFQFMRDRVLVPLAVTIINAKDAIVSLAKTAKEKAAEAVERAKAAVQAARRVAEDADTLLESDGLSEDELPVEDGPVAEIIEMAAADMEEASGLDA